MFRNGKVGVEMGLGGPCREALGDRAIKKPADTTFASGLLLFTIVFYANIAASASSHKE